MDWLISNWTFLVVLAAALGVIYFNIKKFTTLPSEQQLQKVKEWLLFCVITVEKEYSSGTGQLKLRAAYNMFIERFPSLVAAISFELFSQYVDEALVQMKKLLETNKDIEAYVKGN